ncbi:DNA topoisomerase I [Candidatus Micrarchaeota archaeon]|nr:DNA topoisomerase I [Candidatus Micrarchaeota archaeon]
MAVLIICEKPRVAQRVAMALDSNARRKAFNGVAYYEVSRGGEQIYVAPAVGHVYTLKEKNGGGYPVFDVEWVPLYQVEKSAYYTKKYLDVIKFLAGRTQEYVNSCDFDTEGSIIGYNIIRFACGKNTGKRMRFSTLTEDELAEAYDKREELDYNNAYAGEARSILDWLWGINLSRGLMSAVRQSGEYRVMSIGRVQGPTLKILSTREREIAAFIPAPFWQLFAHCRGVKFTHEKGRFFEKKEAEEAKKKTKRSGTVSKVERKIFEQPPNPPFDLTSLQIEAYRWFGFSPSQTQDIAQALYEAGLISYPRTASQKLPAKLNLPRIINMLSKNPNYEKFANELIAKNRFYPREGGRSDSAHPAIFATGATPKKSTPEAELKVYDLIAKRFLSCFAENAVRERMHVELLLGEERYVADGARVLKEGWISFYKPYVRFEESDLSNFKEGEQVEIDKLEMRKDKTKPPARYTPASIVQTLEEKELGTKGTRSTVLDTLYKRGYIADRSIRVTEFGLAVFDTLNHNSPEILDEEMTRKLEKDMEWIQEGTIKEERVIEEGKATLTLILLGFKAKEKEIGRELADALKKTTFDQNFIGKCPKCGGDLKIIVSKATRKRFVGCSSYPKCSQSYPIPQFGSIKPLKKPCKECGQPMIFVRSGKKVFQMCIDPKCKSKEGWGKHEADNSGRSDNKRKASPPGQAKV